MNADIFRSGRLDRRAALHLAGSTSAALAAVALVKHGSAQDEPTMFDHPLVGLWQVSAEPPGPAFGLALYHADGTLQFATPAPAPGISGEPGSLLFQMPAYGVWQPTGARTAEMLGIHMNSDETGAFTDTLTFFAEVEVSESGDDYTLKGSFEIADPAGAVLVSDVATTQGQRVGIRLVGPAATPTA